MKIRLQPIRPRNPLVARTMFRKAGSHRPRRDGTDRQAGRAALRRELHDPMKHSP